MISKFRVDELVTNLYIHGVEYTAKRLKPRQIQEWGSNRLQRAAPRKRERERESYTTYVRRRRGRFGRRRRRHNDVPPLYLFCVPLTTRHNGDRERENRRKDPALLEAALSFISSGRRVTDSESPCYSIAFLIDTFFFFSSIINTRRIKFFIDIVHSYPKFFTWFSPFAV